MMAIIKPPRPPIACPMKRTRAVSAASRSNVFNRFPVIFTLLSGARVARQINKPKLLRGTIANIRFPIANVISRSGKLKFHLRQLYPALSFMTKMEQFGMEHLRQNLQRFGQARSRTIEILVAVGDKDAILFYR